MRKVFCRKTSKRVETVASTLHFPEYPDGINETGHREMKSRSVEGVTRTCKSRKGFDISTNDFPSMKKPVTTRRKPGYEVSKIVFRQASTVSTNGLQNGDTRP